MRRYRKGQFWHPPTAAESAAYADAAGAHQRKPAQPQDHSPIGQHILVKTPAEEEIPARDGDTIYWKKCKRCIQRNTQNEKEIVETDEELIVYNLFKQPIPADQDVETALTECGVRYVLQSPLRFAWATTTALVETTDATFTVKNCQWAGSNADWTGDGSGASAPYLTVQNSPLNYSLSANHTFLMRYMRKHGSTDWAWFPADASCCPDCECECTE